MTKKINKKLISKSPVVVVLGHIDSGKTTLLDQIRKAKIAEEESGGITQHIGAYQIRKGEERITFIDTPGHEAFSQMRSRGAKIADIALLIIDSRKGVETQTKEVIASLKKFNIPTIVVLNKTDRPDADPEKAKRELQTEGILVESLGGKVPSIEISAQTGKGVDDLLDLITLLAKMENLTTDVSADTKGVIIETYLDSQRGPTATSILTQGVLNAGDIMATPSAFGKVKNLENFQGKRISQIHPSDPAIILGLNNVPKMGEEFKVFTNIKDAQAYTSAEQSKAEKIIKKELKLDPDKKILNLILKTDVLGSGEAIEEILKQLPQDKVMLNIIKSGVGGVNENDVKLAKDARAPILAFRTKASPAAENLAERQKVKITNFDIIYELVEAVRKSMEKSLKPEIVRIDLGKMKVLVGFWSDKKRQIVGGRITEGEVAKGGSIEVSRDDEVIDQGRMINLQRNKKDIEKASRGEEIGILYEGKKKIEKGDVLTIFKKEKQKVEL